MANDPTRLRSAEHRTTTPNPAAPRLQPMDEPPLPWRTRIEAIVAAALVGWGLGLVAVAILRSL